MAITNGSNGRNGTNDIAVAPRKFPSIDDLRRAFEEGLPQTLLSGIEVQMRPVVPDKLLMSGKVPDILTPLVMGMLFPPEKEVEADVFPDEVGDYLAAQRDETQERLDFIESVNVVCEASLVDPSIVPYLSLADRMWIFKLAFMPVAVLSTFCLEPARNVEAGDDERTELLQAERDDARDRPAMQAQPADGVSV